MDIGLMIARAVLGLGLAAHGAQKLFGWFGGHGIEGTAGFMESLGFRPGRFFALGAALGEPGGGALTALGLFGPVGPGLMIMVMTVAIFAVHRGNGFFATSNGIELPLLYATGAFVLAFTGPGAYSFDALLGLLWLSTPTTAWIAIASAAVLASANLAARGRIPVGAPTAA